MAGVQTLDLEHQKRTIYPLRYLPPGLETLQQTNKYILRLQFTKLEWKIKVAVLDSNHNNQINSDKVTYSVARRVGSVCKHCKYIGYTVQPFIKLAQ